MLKRLSAIFLAFLLLGGAASAVVVQKKAPAKKSTTGKRTTTRRKKPVVRGQSAPTPQRIREIQSALGQSGEYRGQPTGRIDAPTSSALAKFQQARGLDPSGKLTVRTLRALEKYGLPSNTYSASAAPPAESPGSTKQ